MFRWVELCCVRWVALSCVELCWVAVSCFALRLFVSLCVALRRAAVCCIVLLVLWINKVYQGCNVNKSRYFSFNCELTDSYRANILQRFYQSLLISFYHKYICSTSKFKRNYNLACFSKNGYKSNRCVYPSVCFAKTSTKKYNSVLNKAYQCWAPSELHSSLSEWMSN